MINKIYSFVVLFSFLFLSGYTYADFDNKCSVIITKRLQNSLDPYNYAIEKIVQCKKYDILSVTSFLEADVSKVYITDLIQNFCMFNHEIVTLIDNDTSNLSCVHRGTKRIERAPN